MTWKFNEVRVMEIIREGIKEYGPKQRREALRIDQFQPTLSWALQERPDPGSLDIYQNGQLLLETLSFDEGDSGDYWLEDAVIATFERTTGRFYVDDLPVMIRTHRGVKKGDILIARYTVTPPEMW